MLGRTRGQKQVISKIFFIICIYIILLAVAVVVTLFFLKLFWAWTIPSIFPGAVEQGLIVSSLSWRLALKLSVFMGLLLGTSFAAVRKSN